jgi:undecaprenyl diphosphate synthase
MVAEALEIIERSEIRVPRHVAIIMDGNGRWAEQRELPRLAGHRAGVENIRRILREAANLGIRYITLYAFSTENWSRPPGEVAGLMELLGEFIDRETRGLHEEGVQIRHLGSRDGLPDVLVERIQGAIDLTRDNTRITVAVALNYGGRTEILEAVRSLLDEGFDPASLTDETFARRLSTAGMPDPDLIVRTSGEQRLSNFLTWQAAYTEYWTTPVLWPDFDAEHLRQAIYEFSRRDRRYGGITDREDSPPTLVASTYPEESMPRTSLHPSNESGEDMPAFITVQQAISDYQAGKFVLILDDEDRENEGDLAMAAEFVTPEAINFLATYARGLICMPIIGSRLDELEVPLMVGKAVGMQETHFTNSVDARRGISSGISAADRAWTVKTMIHPLARPSDLVQPGHLFPLRYTEGGVLRRAGHTEASVDLAKLGGLYPAAVICEVMNVDGTMARMPQLLKFARDHEIGVITVQHLIAYRRDRDESLENIAEQAASQIESSVQRIN